MAQSSGERSVEPQAIVGIRRKLARAYSQLEYIQAQMDAYWKRKPVAAVSRFNEDATEYSSYLRIIEPPPIEWAVVFGEAVHNMRSALDHAIYQLTIAHSGKILPMTGFPIFIEMDRFFGCGGERQYKRSGVLSDSGPPARRADSHRGFAALQQRRPRTHRLVEPPRSLEQGQTSDHPTHDGSLQADHPHNGATGFQAEAPSSMG